MTTQRKTNSKRTRTPILPARRSSALDTAIRSVVETLEDRRLMSANIAGDVYQDNNANGAEDAGEPYLAGFSIYIDANHNGQLDQGETSVKSNNLGKYAFSNLPAGTYTLSEQTPAGYTLTQPAGGSVDVTIADGQNGDQDFGNAPTSPVGIIRGSIFNDVNADGVQNNGEQPQVGWTTYIDANQNGQLDQNEPTATTDSTGYYTFQGLTPGGYRVREVIQQGWSQTRPAAGYYDVNVVAGQQAIDKIFGNRQTPVSPPPVSPPPVSPPPPPAAGATITGTAFVDLNANSVKDSNEWGLPGVKVFIDTNANGIADASETATLTNGNGIYSFKGLAAGTYNIAEVVPGGYRATTPSGASAPVTVLANASAVLNFGDTQKALITGTIFNDANGNGAQDVGDLGQANTSVYLDLNKNFAKDANEPTAVTDNLGHYAFNVDAGNYRVRQIVPQGARPTNALFYDFGIASGQILTKNFGNTTNIMLGGNVFNDANGSAAKDAGEAGLQGWQVYVDTNNNGLLDSGEESALTDASGNYRFNDLPAGTYTLRVVQQQTWQLTTPLGGGLTVTLGSGEGTEKLLFGEKLIG